MKKAGTVAGTCPMVWRSTPHTGLLSRPIIGHTPRKLPPCGAISRFIAVSAGRSSPTTRTRLSYRIFCRMSRLFSLFFIIFLKKVWIRQGSHGNGGIFPDRRFFCVPPSASAQRRQEKRPGLSKPGHSIRHRFISVFPCTAGSPPRPEPGSRWDSPSPCARKSPAPYPRR